MLIEDRERSLRRSPRNKSWLMANIDTGMIFIIQLVSGRVDLEIGEEFAMSDMTRETNAI